MKSEMPSKAYRKKRNIDSPMVQGGYGGSCEVIVGWSVPLRDRLVQTTLFMFEGINA